MRHEAFDLAVRPVPGGPDSAVLVEVSGELDLLALPSLRPVLRSLATDGQVHQVVDLTGVTFIDSSGLGVLVGAHGRARGLGGSLRLAGAPPSVRTVMRVTGLTFVLSLHDSVADAVEDLHRSLAERGHALP